jgi:NAD(P)-dependent dehydrogenase (short-subunit alcohol dehydrogenase family)
MKTSGARDKAGALAGKVCVVTGASRGIGRAIAEALAAEGAKLSLCAAREPPAFGDHAARCDVSRAGEVAAFFAASEERLGPPDVLVLNAGVLERAPLEELTEAQWDRVLGVNLKGAYLCARAAWPTMRARRRGRIVAVGSISGTLGTPQASAYNASKWGLTGFIKSIAEEGREHGIFCATVLAGGVDTDMLRQTPFAPTVSAAEVAGVVRYLAAEAPLAMTGSAVEVFG